MKTRKKQAPPVVYEGRLKPWQEAKVSMAMSLQWSQGISRKESREQVNDIWSQQKGSLVKVKLNPERIAGLSPAELTKLLARG